MNEYTTFFKQVKISAILPLSISGIQLRKLGKRMEQIPGLQLTSVDVRQAYCSSEHSPIYISIADWPFYFPLNIISTSHGRHQLTTAFLNARRMWSVQWCFLKFSQHQRVHSSSPSNLKDDVIWCWVNCHKKSVCPIRSKGDMTTCYRNYFLNSSFRNLQKCLPNIGYDPWI